VESSGFVLQISANTADKVHAEICILAEHFEQGQAGEAEVGRQGSEIIHLGDAAGTQCI